MEKKIKIKPVRVQMEVDDQAGSANLFYIYMKVMYPNMKITQNKSMNRKHLDINVRWFNNDGTIHGTLSSIEDAILRKIEAILSLNKQQFYVGDIRIGAPMKCSMCDGTGKSTFPSDRFNKVVGRR